MVNLAPPSRLSLPDPSGYRRGVAAVELANSALLPPTSAGRPVSQLAAQFRRLAAGSVFPFGLAVAGPADTRYHRLCRLGLKNRIRKGNEVVVQDEPAMLTTVENPASRDV
jgi:hypothetical protein